MKKPNNPWYYYLNGKLVKKRKPAKPGDTILIKHPLTGVYQMVDVRNIFMSGIHTDKYAYYKWGDVVTGQEIVDRLNHSYEGEYSYNRIRRENDKLREDESTAAIDLAYNLLQMEYEGSKELQETQNQQFSAMEIALNKKEKAINDAVTIIDELIKSNSEFLFQKESLITDLQATLKDLTEDLHAGVMDHINQVKHFNLGLKTATSAILDKVQTGYHNPNKTK